MKYDEYELEQLLPHSNGMILIDQLLDFQAESVCAIVTIHEQSKFIDDHHRINAWVGVEYMAQTIAAWAGMHARIAGRPISIGFLLGTRRYSTSVSHFSVGDRLTISARRNYQDMDMAVFDCEILLRKVRIISARLTVYQSGLQEHE